MKNSNVIFSALGIGCAVTLLGGILLVGGIFVGGVHLWESLFYSEPLTDQENAKISEVQSSLVDVAGHGAVVSITTDNKMHSSPELKVHISIAESVTAAEAEAIASRSNALLLEQIPNDWEVRDRISYAAMDGLKVDLYQTRAVILPDQFTLAAAAPEGTDWVKLNGLVREVEWHSFATDSCSEPFVVAKQAISTVAEEKLESTVSIEVRTCEGRTTEGDHAFRIIARPEDAGQQIDRLLELQPKLMDRKIDSMAITADSTLVLLEQGFRQKEPGRAEDYQDLWPYGQVVMAQSNILVSGGKPNDK
ncbi:hypothetical protein CKALI_03020 [Corynebacterium kalinowskii]|uniref:Uncharacterized protein n=1 Tax=Corynebacterium kalinowskii TaxID=2675216 RepID=A0A6B8VPK2_9CORY|nr:hypothetical protein [Corynebacterium kalinowskii]QGU01487.1 hypothetical protein CKALI_03020 [Corynebacterium kalinowskii]